MNTEIKTGSAAQTEQLGRSLGVQLKGGEVIELIGDVGAGKTTFVRGLAMGLGAADNVTSPTFTVCNSYKGRLMLHHCDFYRLNDDALIKKELAELIDGQSVVVLEWADEVNAVLPDECIKIRINSDGDYSRALSIEISKQWNIKL